jgi:hypothetical protein
VSGDLVLIFGPVRDSTVLTVVLDGFHVGVVGVEGLLQAVMVKAMAVMAQRVANRFIVVLRYRDFWGNWLVRFFFGRGRVTGIVRQGLLWSAGRTSSNISPYVRPSS